MTSAVSPVPGHDGHGDDSHPGRRPTGGYVACVRGAMSMAMHSADARHTRRLHPMPIRIMHWINAFAMIVMITSGWGIYDDDVIIRSFFFPEWARLGGWAAPSLLYHFAGMWLLAVNGLCYLIYGAVTGRFRDRLLPIRVSELVETVRDTLHLRISHEDLTTYNAVQKALYIVVIVAGVSQVVTGLAIWKPVQFSGLVSLLGGFQTARVLHFTGMVVIVGFLLVHVLLSLLVPRTLWAMLTGGPQLDRSRSS